MSFNFVLVIAYVDIEALAFIHKAIYFNMENKVCQFCMFEFALLTRLNCREIYKLDLDIIDDDIEYVTFYWAIAQQSSQNYIYIYYNIVQSCIISNMMHH